MSIAVEVGKLAELIAGKFSGTKIYRFQGPDIPGAEDCVIELRQETRRGDSRTHTIAERQYAIIYYAEQVETAIITLEALSRYVMNERPEAASVGSEAAGAIQVESFAISAPEKIEDGLLKCTGLLLVRSRESIALPHYEKINKVEIRTTIN
ncbi:hypothetical protein ACTHPF_05380 [Paenibacillus sp. SAF-054]|uniref:hypothetical protein n=1 Tax=unclassified Paenibacillus TaxID=185978 RepID=UPI003F801C79